MSQHPNIRFTLRLPDGLRSRGLTFMELLIGLAVTAVVCGVLAVLINATALGTNTTNDGRRALTREQSLKACLKDELANARAVLAVGTNYIVYWRGDQPGAVTPANGAVNLSELRLLEVDTTTGNLNLYTTQWPAGFTNANIVAADQTYAAGTSWYSAAAAAKGTYFLPTVLATTATALSVSLDSASPAQAKLVTVTIGLNDSGVTRQLSLSTALVNQGSYW